MAGAAMELTCTSFSFPLLPFERSVQVIALLGLEYVDLGAHVEGTHLQPERIEADPRGGAARVREAIGAAGLGASDFFPTFGRGFRDRAVNTPDPALRDANRRRFAAFVEFCNATGCPGMTLLPGVIWDDLGPERSFALAVEALGEFVRDGRAAGLRVSVEPHLESVVEAPVRALELVEAVPGLQFTLDYSHFIAAGVPAARVHPLIPHAGHFHARQAAPGHLQTVRAEGTIDFADIVRRLRAAGYAGFLSIEYTWQEWRDCNRLDVLAESALLRDELRGYVGVRG
ncbi:MAG TPA: sugar phosphate isomerase/epimerase [Thermomicrobiales bacterium]|nr:sugar phosphate isomerase/epimerase [Thermomicrobiales bacterium]